ncbi:MAG: hypothetical protein P0121_00805 [Nitrospira sp.]|nr:hypothetical protein [Nitrospira sp.]
MSNSDRSTQMRKIQHIVRLNSDLRGPIDPEGIRNDLARAQVEGFDPKDLYEKCVQAKHLKGDLKYPAPRYSEVEPSSPTLAVDRHRLRLRRLI